MAEWDRWYGRTHREARRAGGWGPKFLKFLKFLVPDDLNIERIFLKNTVLRCSKIPQSFNSDDLKNHRIRRTYF